METDRHASDGQDRLGGSEPPAHDGPPAHDRSTGADAPPESAPPPGDASPAPGDGETSEDPREYAYGEDPLEAAGTGGPRAADSGTADPGAAEPRTADPGAADPGAADTGATTPRAVLRPVPEGFPTPPPRPARPNRRPAPTSEPAATPDRRRRLLIVGISAAAALLLIVVVGGGLLALRYVDSAGTPAAPPPSAADDPGSRSTPAQTGPGSTEIADVVVTEVSTEVGVRAVGASGSRMEPEGEFVIVTFAVENPTSAGIQIGDNVSLETADGTYPVDRDAARVHTARTRGFGVVPPDDSRSFHAVFDVPIGADPTGLHLELVEVGESGTLPLSA